ncbi:MAG TPA: DUF899 domain-containing protein [Polyangiaceae bacterium]|nr:DUF899 domain-containing protein [Polyangiaceae bacterium]
MTTHRIVNPEEWTVARKALLAKEKEFQKARDAVAEARRELPWERVEKRYLFDGPNGEETLADLFDGRSQLVVYHFMLGPNATVGCKSCSWWADNFERHVVHLAHRDVTMLAVSRGSLRNIEAFRKRLGWTFKWVSSARSDFNFDFRVSFEEGKGDGIYNYAPKSFGGSELPGISVFFKDTDGAIYHTYSTYGRGLDNVNAGYQILDLVPKGRDEAGLPSPNAWLRHRDAYDVAS